MICCRTHADVDELSTVVSDAKAVSSRAKALGARNVRSLRDDRADVRKELSRLCSTRLCAEEFDFSRSTHANYACTPAEASPSLTSVSAFADIRNMLDLDYHGVYSAQRQELQDQIVRQVVEPGTAQQKPWIVFTAGAMGAGKSRVINWMSERAIFPLSNIVQLDPDVFKVAMPEWEGYVSRDPLTAGYHTRKESGFLVEVAQELAMRQFKHVWIDGSLRDGDWYLQTFNDIKRRHPAYRIAIFHVVATKEVILERVARRAVETGRHVPEAEVLDSIQRNRRRDPNHPA